MMDAVQSKISFFPEGEQVESHIWLFNINYNSKDMSLYGCGVLAVTGQVQRLPVTPKIEHVYAKKSNNQLHSLQIGFQHICLIEG